MTQKQTGKKIQVWLLAAALLTGTLTGCSMGGNPGNTGIDGSLHQDGNDAQDGQQGTAMGRYVEREVELSYSLSDFNSRLFQQKDGSLFLIDNSGFVLGSWDDGGTWIAESMPWLTQMAQEGNLIMSVALGEDQSAAVIYCAPEEADMEDDDNADGEEETEETDNTDVKDMDMMLLLVKPDGTKIPVEADLPEEDADFYAVYISDTGRIIASTLSSTLYEIKEDGTCRKFLTVEEGRPELVRFYGKLMFMDGVGYEAPLIYDMEAENYIEDKVLSDFVKENFGERDSFTGKNYDLFLLPVSDEVVYLAGQTGIYRHVLGGAAIEQVVDGNLSILGNPTYSIMDMIVAGEDEFLVLLTGQKLMHFVYDPDIPTVPNDRLEVYSLDDKATIRQAINLYQAANPSVYVNYEIGLEQAGSATREDAIKNLNTRIMSGKGPDVLILDNLPVNSYMEKGLLMDIGPILDSLEKDEAVFPNVLAAFENDGHVYMAPCEIQLPFILGNASGLEKMTDMSCIADAIEDARKNNPGSNLLRFSSPKAVMRIFSMTSMPSWRIQDGKINREAISDFLIQSKRIYDAQMDGLSEEAVEEWDIWCRYYMEDYGQAFEDSDELRMSRDEIYFMGGYCKFVVGSMKDIDEYTLQMSLAVSEGMEECEVIPMPGQAGHVLWARSLLGISAVSENTALAEDFLKVVFGNEVQKNVLGGIPVNQKAILDNYDNQRRLYKDNDYISGSSSLSDEEGFICDILIRVPKEEQVDELLAWIASTDTVYMEDFVFENVVYEEGIAYMQGDQSLEEALDAIEMRLGIYLAE